MFVTIATVLLSFIVFLSHKFKWHLSIYSYILREKIEQQQKKLEKSRRQMVYMDEDEQGAFIILDLKETTKVYLKASKAKPLCGFPVGSAYYTTNECDKLVPIIPRGNF